jgi:hypothetical protein
LQDTLYVIDDDSSISNEAFSITVLLETVSLRTVAGSGPLTEIVVVWLESKPTLEYKKPVMSVPPPSGYNCRYIVYINSIASIVAVKDILFDGALKAPE